MQGRSVIIHGDTYRKVVYLVATEPGHRLHPQIQWRGEQCGIILEMECNTAEGGSVTYLLSSSWGITTFISFTFILPLELSI